MYYKPCKIELDNLVINIITQFMSPHSVPKLMWLKQNNLQIKYLQDFKAVRTGIFPAESPLPLPGATMHNTNQNPALARPVVFMPACLLMQAWLTNGHKKTRSFHFGFLVD